MRTLIPIIFVLGLLPVELAPAAGSEGVVSKALRDLESPFFETRRKAVLALSQFAVKLPPNARAFRGETYGDTPAVFGGRFDCDPPSPCKHTCHTASPGVRKPYEVGKFGPGHGTGWAERH